MAFTPHWAEVDGPLPHRCEACEKMVTGPVWVYWHRFDGYNHCVCASCAGALTEEKAA
jgi:hypothetical protein